MQNHRKQALMHILSRRTLLEMVVRSLLNNKQKSIYWEDVTVLPLNVPNNKTSKQRYIIMQNLAELQGEITNPPLGWEVFLKNRFRCIIYTP